MDGAILAKTRAAHPPYPREEKIFQYLNNGPLSLPYLAELLKHDFPTTTVRNLAVGMHGCYYYCTVKPERPGNDLFGYPVRKYITYSNSKDTDRYAINHGLYTHKSPSLSESTYRHSYFLAHIIALMRIGARKHNQKLLMPKKEPLIESHISHEFRVWDDTHHAWKKETHLSDEHLEPDKVFLYEKDGKEELLFVEADKGNEQVWCTNLEKKAWLPTVLKYIYVIEKGIYKEHFNVDCPARVLVFCTDRGKLNAIEKMVNDITKGKGRNYFCFKLWFEFDDKKYVPTEVDYSKYEGGFERVGTDPGTKLDYQPYFLV